MMITYLPSTREGEVRGMGGLGSFGGVIGLLGVNVGCSALGVRFLGVGELLPNNSPILYSSIIIH